MDFLKSAVASAISKGPLGSYSVGDRVDVENSIWTLHNATKRDNNSACSIFTFDIPAGRGRIPIARNAVRKARTLRHPGVVKVVDTIETETQLIIVTERVTPLSWYTKRKSLGEETLKWGLCGVARTVKFINDEASSVHGCIRSSSIFVGDNGEWKIGALDLLSSVKEDDAVIYQYSSLVPDIGRVLPPEVQGGNWDSIKKNPISATDSFGYGLLCHECFAGSFASAEQATQAKAVPSDMQVAWRRLLNPSPKTRLSTANFLEQGRRIGGFFNSPLINLSEGVDQLGLMTESERDEFFGQLDELSSEFPEEFMKRKILPELLKSVEFGGGGPRVFRVVMQIGSHLAEDEYDSTLTPVLVRLFASPDRAMRVCLIENLHLIIDHLSSKLVNDKIFPNLVTGFTDQAPILREQTVKSVLLIVNKLSERTVNGELLRYLAKTANDAEPGIRTNTTICLGKIAKNLNKSTRSKVLVAAFTRALKDPFVHARNAALLALGATTDIFTEDDAANKVLPALCPSLIDKERVVRDQANKTLDLYLTRVRKYGASLPETVAPPAAANGAAGPKPGVLPTDTGSWTGWAISSFTNKLSAADGEIQPKALSPGPASVAAAATPRSMTASPSSRPTSSVGGAGLAVPQTQPAPKPALSRNATDTTKLAASFTAPEITENEDFWGSIDDDADGADKQTDENASVATNDDLIGASNGAQTPAKSDTGGEPDFAAWLNAQSGAKPSSKALPKGMGQSKSRPTSGKTTPGSIVGGAKKKAVPRVVQRPAEAEPEPEKKPEAAPTKTAGEDDGWGDW